MNGLALMRAIDWRTSSSRSGNASGAHVGLMPVASCSERRKSSSLNVSIPQSVWWRSTISSVPSACCEIASERIVSSVTTPPALRITWASPSSSPRTRVGISRASMHATTASLRPGGIGRSALSKLAAYCSALRRTSSVVLMGGLSLEGGRPILWIPGQLCGVCARRLVGWRREVLGVHDGEALPLLGQLVLGEARIHRAGLDASVAVDALLGVDVQLLNAFVVGLVRRRVDAVHRAHLDAGVVLGADARLGDHVSHARSISDISRAPRRARGPLSGHRRAPIRPRLRGLELGGD